MDLASTGRLDFDGIGALIGEQLGAKGTRNRVGQLEERLFELSLVEAPQGGIMGVYSRSEEQPVKSGAFAVRDAALEGAKTYAEWRFAHVPSPIGLSPAREGAKGG